MQKNIIAIPRVATTIPHGDRPGRGVGGAPQARCPGNGSDRGAVRAVLEAAGVRDVLSKSLGSGNAINTVRAAMDGLQRLKYAEQVARARGKTAEELVPWQRERKPGAAVEESAAEAAEAAPQAEAEAAPVAEAEAAPAPTGEAETSEIPATETPAAVAEPAPEA